MEFSCFYNIFITTQLHNRLPYFLENILNGISEFDAKGTPIDFDDFEFLINIRGNYIEIMKYNFQKTNFVINVTNKMLELIQKYIGNLVKNNVYGINNKIEKYKKYCQILKDN